MRTTGEVYNEQKKAIVETWSMYFILLNLQAVYVPPLWGSLIMLLCKPLSEVIFISEISFKRAVIKRGKQTKKRNTRNTHFRENLALLSTRFNVMVLAECRYNGGLSQRV